MSTEKQETKTYYIVELQEHSHERFFDLAAAERDARACAAPAGAGYEYIVLKAISRHKAEKPQVISEELE